MSKPKVLVAHGPIHEQITDKLKKRFEVQIINKNWSRVTKQDLLENIPEAFGLILVAVKYFSIDEEILDAAGPNLKVISLTSMGYDRIDIIALKKRNILLGNCSTADNAFAVAEVAVGLLIATEKNFIEANEQIKTGKIPVLQGMGLTNSVVGIVGCGNIGITVVELLNGFKFSELLYTSRKPKPEVERLGGKMVSVDYLVRRSDFIVLTSVLSPETKFIINKDRLAAMKPNAIIINVGRGQLIDQDALINALQEKRIRGAGLDVMTPEPLPLDNPLIMMKNVVLLPHISGTNTDGSFGKKLNLAADNVLAVLNNQPMPCEVKL